MLKLSLLIPGRQLACLAALLALAAGGCSGGRTPVFPVSGKVLVNGRPAAGATVFFHPQSPVQTTADARPLAVVQDDGSFQATTFLSKDGAPQGDYALTVVWPTREVVEGGEVIEGPDQLQGRYAQPANPVARIQVRAGTNEIPAIELPN